MEPKKRSPFDPRDRPQTTGEEVANAVTHGLGAVLSIACLSVGVVFAALRHDVWSVVSISIFGTTMFILYFFSTLYHAVTSPRVKDIFNLFDHAAIYLLIAGSYTPFCLVGIRPENPIWAWTILILVWAIAVFGVIFQCLFVNRHPVFSTATYIVMGWIILLAVRPLWQSMGPDAVGWIALGGLIYSLGVIFYAMKQVKYMHTVWHLFVLGGTLIHYSVMLYYLILRNGHT